MAKINYKSDFKVVVTLILNGVAVPVPDHDFGLSFFTTDDPDRVFVAGRWGGKLHNCKIDGGHVVALVDDHHLGTGTLMVDYRDDAPDADMGDGVLTTVTPSALDVELVSGAGDGSAVEAEVVVDITTAIAEAKAAAERADAIAADLAAKRDADYWRGATGPQGPQGPQGPEADLIDYYTKEQVNALIPTVPTNVSAFNNDAGYLTQHQDISGKADVVQMVTDSTAREDETLTLAANKFYKWSGGWSGTITLSLTAASSGLSVWAGKFLCNDASLSLSMSPAVEVVDAPDFAADKWFEFNVVDGVMLLKEVGDE